MTVRAVGVDGWKDGWVAAVLDDGDRLTWRAYPQPGPGQPRDAFARLLDDHQDATVAVDIPIGLADGSRAADAAARSFLRDTGGPWQSIFLTPVASVVAAFEAGLTHAQAMAARPPGSPGTSIQAWHLIAKMLEVRDALMTRPGASVVEAHPECSFRRLDASMGAASKKTGRGAGLRLRALRTVFDVDLADAPPDVPVDDLLDACAVAWTARRVLDATAQTLPADAAGQGPRIVV